MEHHSHVLNALKKLLICNAVLCLTLLISDVKCEVQNCTNLFTEQTRKSVLQTLNTHSAYVTSLPDIRSGSKPLFLLHPAGTCVNGTVVIYHGFSYNAAGSRLQAHFLFNNGFNVFAVNLAGFAQTSERWMRSKLRNPQDFETVRKTLLEDKRISIALQLLSSRMTQIQNRSFLKSAVGGLLVPVVKNILSRPDPEFRKASEIVSLIFPIGNFNDPLHIQKYNQYFESEHTRYEWEALARLSDVQALPGPLFIIGYSFGGPTSLNAIAISRAVKRAVMLAPFFLSDNVDLVTFQWIASTLGLIDKYTIGAMPLDASIVGASYALTASAMRDIRTSRARVTTETLCIMAEDDQAINVEKSIEMCNSKLGGKSIMYPGQLGLGHAIIPEAGNEYSDAMMKQIVDFFLTGSIDKQSFLEKNTALLL